MRNLKLSILGFVLLSACFSAFGQEQYKDPKNKKYVETYDENLFHQVKQYTDARCKKKPKNVILLIGDGMGLGQIFSGMVANKGHLNLENFKHCGFSRTQSASDFVTDSGAGGTALATGVRTKNHAIGVDSDNQKVENIREKMSAEGFSTGIITTALINHATPATFLSHRPSRKQYEDIAMDIMNSDVDFAIGGGRKHFEKRKDQLNLTDSLREREIQVVYNTEDFESIKEGRVIGLFADMHITRYPERKDMMPRCVRHGLQLLSGNKKGFFLMVEGSKIDAGSHQNKTPFVVKEMLDFDQVIGEALAFAVKDRETLVLVTADHETGGMAITGGDMNTGMVKASYVYGKHTGTPVPVFAFGPGAEQFTGFMDNTDIPKRILNLLNLK